MKRRIGSLLLLCLLCACLCTQALAVSPQSCAEELSAIDVFRGTDTGFELDRAPKRSEAAVMLVRLYGAEEEALSLYEAGLIAHPFEDVSGWAAPYLAWLYSEGLVRGARRATVRTPPAARGTMRCFCCARWAIRTARTLPGPRPKTLPKPAAFTAARCSAARSRAGIWRS